MIFLQDPDVTLHHGDVLETLAELPAGSVDCVITSPPYWGLRDYGTGEWDGGDPECDHRSPTMCEGRNEDRAKLKGSEATNSAQLLLAQRSACGKCGAVKIDQQLGLEPTPDEYVARMVDVFREVRRVLADHGTCWVNLGDSYASQPAGNAPDKPSGFSQKANRAAGGAVYLPQKDLSGLKPKDLVGIPWRVAFALQADGWYLRSDIVWAKSNPMPESVTDRPTKSHEYVFLLSKRPRYFFDQEAVREPHTRLWDAASNGGSMATTRHHEAHIGGSNRHERPYPQPNPAGRNIRSVWDIATQPFPEAHFATFPEELVRRCLLAGCPEWVCRVCGKPRERVVEKDYLSEPTYKDAGSETTLTAGRNRNVQTLGFTDCGHNDYRPGVVLDPFMGSGTVAVVARKHNRHAVGVDLNPDYCAMAAKRLSQQSLFAEAL